MAQLGAGQNAFVATMTALMYAEETGEGQHVDLAIAALEAGKHVLVEKPVAVTADEVRRLAEVDARTDALCMPAMCMRFWPAWTWLAERVREGTYGAVRSAAFQRRATPPRWGGGVYEDDSRPRGEQTFERRQRGSNPTVIGHLSARRERHVEVRPQKDPLSGE